MRRTIATGFSPLGVARGCSARGTRQSPHVRSEEHTSELQSQSNLVCRLLLEKKKNNTMARGGPHSHRCAAIDSYSGPLNITDGELTLVSVSNRLVDWLALLTPYHAPPLLAGR